MIEELEYCFVCNKVPVEEIFDICDACWDANPFTKYLEDDENDN